jgi:hypothetical protein
MFRFLMAAILSLAAVDAAHAQGTPLARYPGFGHDPEADAAQHLRDERARASITAECMRTKGFTYHVTLPVRGDTVPGSEPPQDPNEAYFASLTADRQREYNIALYGIPDPDSEVDAEDAAATGAPRAPGCRDEALRRVPGVFEARSALAEDFVRMRRSVLEDPRVRPAVERWSTCMWQRGEHHPSPQAMMRAADDIALVRARGELTRISTMEREWERAEPVAEACLGQARVEQVIRAVRIDYEQSFVAAHQDVLDAFLRRLQTRNP